MDAVIAINTTTSINGSEHENQLNPSQESQSTKDIIGPDLMFALSILIYYGLQTPVLFLGTITNLLVMITFVKTGINDSVTVCFFALSISDFGYSILFFISRLTAMLQKVSQRPFNIRLDLLAFVLTHYGLIFNDASILITVFTAVQKCCCVAIPHLFKHVFTAKRAAIIILVVTLPFLCLYISLNHTLTLKPTFFASTNRTLIYLQVHPLYFEIAPVWRIASRVILPITAQGIILICLFIMSFKLKQSAKFRSISTNQKEDKEAKTKSRDSSRLGPNETRAIRAVTVVSVIFTTAAMPMTIMYVFKMVFPILEEPRHKNVRSLVDNAQNILFHVNAAVNLFVYLKFNTKFKETFFETFPWVGYDSKNSS